MMNDQTSISSQLITKYHPMVCKLAQLTNKTIRTCNIQYKNNKKGTYHSQHRQLIQNQTAIYINIIFKFLKKEKEKRRE